ncbi:MAG: hypothetical protein R3C05_21470 [Pirellulaceae bacterium]
MKETITIDVAEVNALPVLAAIGNKNASEHVELAFNASPPIPTMAPPMCWPSAWRRVLARFLLVRRSRLRVRSLIRRVNSMAASLTRLRIVNDGTVDVKGNDYDRGGSQRLAGTGGDWQQERVGACGTGIQCFGHRYRRWPRQCGWPSAWRLVLARFSRCDDHASGAFTYTGELDGGKSYTFDVIVNDGTVDVKETITIDVVEVNALPVLAAIGNRSVLAGDELTFVASATDTDDGPKQYEKAPL